MSFQNYEYYLDENIYGHLAPHENLESEFSKCTEDFAETLDFEYYQHVAEDPYRNINCPYDGAVHFDDSSNFPCYIFPAVYRQPDGPPLFRSDHKRVYPSYRKVGFNNSLPINIAAKSNTRKLYAMRVKDYFTGTVEDDDVSDRKSVFTDFTTNTDVMISEENLTFTANTNSALCDSDQELESIYTSNFIYDSTPTDASQSTGDPTVEKMKSNKLKRSCSQEKNVLTEKKCYAEVTGQRLNAEDAMDSLDKFLIRAAQQNTFNAQETYRPTLPSKPFILFCIKSILSWLKFIPLYTYKYCLKHVLFI